jgi:nitrate reductase gamma subunit
LLALLGGIAASGSLVSYWLHVNIVEVKAFVLGILTLQPVAPPQHALFLVHLFLVLMLMIYFPSSKLLHAGGILFSPTRTQPFQVQSGGKRYINPLDDADLRSRRPLGVLIQIRSDKAVCKIRRGLRLMRTRQ